MANSDLVTFDSMLREMFPLPGQPVAEWVLKARAERAELERTGKRVPVEGHDDNTGMNCRNVGPATLVDDLVNHDCCHLCGERGERIVRIDSGALPLVLQRSDQRHYLETQMVPCWAAWCAMWREITELRARAFEADRVMFE